MTNKNKNTYKVPNFDFATLYPNVVVDYSGSMGNNEIFMEILRERERIKRIKERKEKLERINRL